MKIDNSYLNEKVKLRIDSLPNKDEIFVLEAFAGEGKIWNKVIKQTDKQIKILKIEMEHNKTKMFYLQGDNRKYLKTLDLSKFDIIDLDAYGIPFEQLEIVFKSDFKGIVHVTAIQSGMGILPKKLLYKLGYTKEMIKKIKSIFNRNGLGKLKNYLYLCGIKEVVGYFINRKNYFYFNIN